MRGMIYSALDIYNRPANGSSEVLMKHSRPRHTERTRNELGWGRPKAKPANISTYYEDQRPNGAPAKDHPSLVHVRLGELRVRDVRRCGNLSGILRVPVQGGGRGERPVPRHHLYRQLDVEPGRGNLHWDSCHLQSVAGGYLRPHPHQEDAAVDLCVRRLSLYGAGLLLRVHVRTLGVAIRDVHPCQHRLRRVAGILQLLPAAPGAKASAGRHQQPRLCLRLRGRRADPADTPGPDTDYTGLGHRGPGHQGCDSIYRPLVVWMGALDVAGAAGAAHSASR